MKPKIKNVNFKSYKKALKRREMIKPFFDNENYIVISRQSGKFFSWAYLVHSKIWSESLIKSYRLGKINIYKERKISKCKI